jgi:hypothetical protein
VKNRPFASISIVDASLDSYSGVAWRAERFLSLTQPQAYFYELASSFMFMFRKIVIIIMKRYHNAEKSITV